jgi:hypothetical protein
VTLKEPSFLIIPRKKAKKFGSLRKTPYLCQRYRYVKLKHFMDLIGALAALAIIVVVLWIGTAIYLKIKEGY